MKNGFCTATLKEENRGLAIDQPSTSKLNTQKKFWCAKVKASN